MATEEAKPKRVKLTNGFVEKLKPQAKRYTVADSEVVGLQVRVTPNGVKTFQVRYRLKDGTRVGVTIGNSTGMTVDKARELALKEINTILDGVNPNAQKREARKRPGVVTLGSFLDTTYRDYLEKKNYRARDNTIARLQSEKTFKSWLNRPLDWITMERVEDWQERYKREAFKAWQEELKAKDKMHKEVSYDKATTSERERFDSAGNRHIACLRAVLSYALKKKHLQANPLQNYPLKEREAEAKFFTPEQQRKLFEAIDAREQRMRNELAEWNRKRRERGEELLPEYGHFADYVRPLVTLLFATGARRGEALGLKWGDVDLEAGTVKITMENAKTKRERVLPLTQSALETLRIWRDQTDGYFPDRPIFISGRHGGAIGDIKKVWAKLLKDAGLPRLGLHAIRHAVATAVLQRTDLATTQKILGHSLNSIHVTSRYLHTSNDRMRQGLEGLEDRQGNIVPFEPKAEAEA